MTKQKQSSDTDTDTDTDAQRTSRRGVTTVITLTLVVGVVLAASISPLGIVAAATDFSVTTTAPETVSPDETIDITYTIENTGDTALESLGLNGTPQTSDTELTITDAASDSAATITEDNRIIFETVAPGASVTATLTVAVGTDATGTESLTAETTNGFGESEVSKQTVTEFTVTTENTPPTADAGTDQTVDEESQLALDGTGSSDPDGDSLSYGWTQTSGPSVSLQDSETPTPEFTAPSVTSDTTLTFELTVTDDNGGQDTDTVAIVVEPQQGQINVTRQVSSTEVSPGGEVTLTTEVSGVSGSDSVSITSSYDPALDSAPTGSVAVDDGALSPSNIDADASPTGSTLTVSNLDTTTTDSGSVTVTVTETLTGAEEAGVTHSITGSVTAGDTQIDVDPVEVRVTDPEDESTIDVTRTVSADEVAPNDQVTVTTEMTGVSGAVSTTSSYDPQVASATVQSVTMNGASASPIIATGQSGGSVVTLGDVGTGTDATVRITEELTVGEQTDVTHEITGEVTAGETSTEVDPVSVTVAEPQSVVDEYDTDNDGTISITELGAAGADFASGELTITELGRIGAEFAS